jgi:hypothetical protein
MQRHGFETDEDPTMKASGKKSWKVEVLGLVSHLDGRMRVAAPAGEYLMEEIGLGRYRLSGRDKPTFELSITEVSTYINEHHLKVEGGFPVRRV